MFGSLQEAIELGDGKRKDDGGVPRFEIKAVPKSGVNSEPGEYEDVEWVTIFNKGDPKNIQERPVREADKKRWPEAYKAFKEGGAEPLNGIPLDDFPKISPAERMRCKALHIRTVEDLAGYPDGQIKDLGGRGHALQKAAKEYIEFVNSDQSMSELLKQVAELQKELKELKSGNGTGSNTKRGAGDKSTKAKRSNRWGSGSGRKGATDTEDSGEETE